MPDAKQSQNIIMSHWTGIKKYTQTHHILQQPERAVQVTGRNRHATHESESNISITSTTNFTNDSSLEDNK